MWEERQKSYLYEDGENRFKGRPKVRKKDSEKSDHGGMCKDWCYEGSAWTTMLLVRNGK